MQCLEGKSDFLFFKLEEEERHLEVCKDDGMGRGWREGGRRGEGLFSVQKPGFEPRTVRSRLQCLNDLATPSLLSLYHEDIYNKVFVVYIKTKRKKERIFRV